MDVVFFLIRLPFFLVGLLLLLAIDIIVLALVICLSPIVVPLAVAIWLLFLLFAFIGAAFQNRTDVLASFFQGTEEWLSYMFGVYVMGYLKPHWELFEWLVGDNK